MYINVCIYIYIYIYTHTCIDWAAMAITPVRASPGTRMERLSQSVLRAAQQRTSATTAKKKPYSCKQHLPNIYIYIYIYIYIH